MLDMVQKHTFVLMHKVIAEDYSQSNSNDMNVESIPVGSLSRKRMDRVWKTPSSEDWIASLWQWSSKSQQN